MASNDETRAARFALTRREWLLGSASLIAGAALGAPGLARAGNTLTTLRLSSATTRPQAPFACAQAFGPGEIPAGSAVDCGLAAFQSVVKNRWPDGSIKLALLAGRADVQAGDENPVPLFAGPARGGSLLSEADLLGTGVDATLAYSPYGSVALSSLLGVSSVFDIGSGRWTAGRVSTWFEGPEAASWIYYSPIGADDHLTAWFEVRLWRGGAIELLCWIENGFLRVPAPAARSGQATLVVAGSQRFDAALSLPHHTRAVLASGDEQTHWSDSAIALQPLHNTAHLQSTGLVPSYRPITHAASPLLDSFADTYSPQMQANYPAAMGSAGYDRSIGLLPEWDVAYLTSGADQRALRAVQINACAAGRYALHYRDEATLRPLRFSQHPNLVLNGNNSGVSSVGSSSTNDYTPLPVDAGAPTWATSHHPSIGYLAYLLSGRWYFMEQTQFSAALGFLKQTDIGRGLSDGVLHTAAGANTTRGVAWSLRSLAQAASATPDDDQPLRDELLASIEANVRDYHARNLAQAAHPQGVCRPYSDYTSGDGVYFHASWMEDFLTASFGYLIALRLPLPADATQQLDAFFVWKCRSIMGRLGEQGTASSYNFRDAAQYTLAVAPSDNPDWNTGAGPWYADWGAIYQATTGEANIPAADTSLRGGYFPEPTSYWGNLQPAIAYAVSHVVPGAAEAFARMTSASNWPQFTALEPDQPVWSVKPFVASDPLRVFHDGFER